MARRRAIFARAERMSKRRPDAKKAAPGDTPKPPPLRGTVRIVGDLQCGSAAAAREFEAAADILTQEH